MEIYIDVEDSENYAISNLGNIKAKPKVRISKNGSTYYSSEIILKPNLKKNGYLEIILTKDKIRKNFSIHRLVAIAFIPNPENKPQVNHINGIKTDNRVENLEWNTPKENINHAVENKFINQKGEDCIFSKLTESDIHLIRESKCKVVDIAKEYGMRRESISSIRNRKSWKHI